jgi:dihydrolipoamide dehydrogenase
MDGLLVASSISGQKSFRDYRCIPWAVFCDPEIAVCGLSESEARIQGLSVQIGKFPFAASGKALASNQTDGFIKVVVNQKDESILGVHIVGSEAANLIAEAALAIEMGACVEDVVRTIHTHPTLPEVFPEAIEMSKGLAIHAIRSSRTS